MLFNHEITRTHRYPSPLVLLRIATRYDTPTDDEKRRRFQTLILNLTNTLAEGHGHETSTGKLVGWNEFVASNQESVSQLDEAIFGLAHLFADLTAVNGAVVFTGGFELLGFGAEISGGSEPLNPKQTFTYLPYRGKNPITKS